jgi:hypothetical protein
MALNDILLTSCVLLYIRTSYLSFHMNTSINMNQTSFKITSIYSSIIYSMRSFNNNFLSCNFHAQKGISFDLNREETSIHIRRPLRFCMMNGWQTSAFVRKKTKKSWITFLQYWLLLFLSIDNYMIFKNILQGYTGVSISNGTDYFFEFYPYAS